MNWNCKENYYLFCETEIRVATHKIHFNWLYIHSGRVSQATMDQLLKAYHEFMPKFEDVVQANYLDKPITGISIPDWRMKKNDDHWHCAKMDCFKVNWFCMRFNRRPWVITRKWYIFTKSRESFDIYKTRNKWSA